MGNSKPVLRELVDPETLQRILMDLLEEAGIRNDEKVMITVEPGHLSVRRDPVAHLWGALAGSKEKDPRKLLDEAMEEAFGVVDDSDERELRWL